MNNDFEYHKWGDDIGRLLLIEFDEQDNDVFNEIMRTLDQHPVFEKLELCEKSVLSLPGLDVYSKQRKAYCGGQEMKLTVKEYELLKLLIENSGRVLTYGQMYQNVWKEPVQMIRNSTIHFHINNLKKKIENILPNAKFEIRCLREVGYCLDIMTD